MVLSGISLSAGFPVVGFVRGASGVSWIACLTVPCGFFLFLLFPALVVEAVDAVVSEG